MSTTTASQAYGAHRGLYFVVYESMIVVLVQKMTFFSATTNSLGKGAYSATYTARIQD